MVDFLTLCAIFVSLAMVHTPDAGDVDKLEGAPFEWRERVAYPEIARAAYARQWRGWDAIDRISIAFTVVLFETGGRARFQLRHETGTEWNDGGTSRCLFQISNTAALVPFARWRVSLDEWATLTGDGEAVARCANAGARLLAYHAGRCRIVKSDQSSAHRLLTAYRSGASCDERDDRDQVRAAFFARFRDSLRRKVDAEALKD